MVLDFDSGTGSARTESEGKAILVGKNGLFTFSCLMNQKQAKWHSLCIWERFVIITNSIDSEKNAPPPFNTRYDLATGECTMAKLYIKDFQVGEDVAKRAFATGKSLVSSPPFDNIWQCCSLDMTS